MSYGRNWRSHRKAGLPAFLPKICLKNFRWRIGFSPSAPAGSAEHGGSEPVWISCQRWNCLGPISFRRSVRLPAGAPIADQTLPSVMPIVGQATLFFQSSTSATKMGRGNRRGCADEQKLSSPAQPRPQQNEGGPRDCCTRPGRSGSTQEAAQVLRKGHSACQTPKRLAGYTSATGALLRLSTTS